MSQTILDADMTQVLVALRSMAVSQSTRCEADVLACLARAKISLTFDEVLSIVKRLQVAGYIGRIVALEDGDFLVTLTGKGLGSEGVARSNRLPHGLAGRAERTVIPRSHLSASRRDLVSPRHAQPAPV